MGMSRFVVKNEFVEKILDYLIDNKIIHEMDRHKTTTSIVANVSDSQHEYLRNSGFIDYETTVSELQ